MEDEIARLIRCDIYAGGTRIRTFPDDRALQIVKAFKRGEALVLQCRDASGALVEVETTLRYLLIQSAEPPAAGATTQDVPSDGVVQIATVQ